MKIFKILFLGLLFAGIIFSAQAQQSIFVELPDATIMADKVTRGDSDTYGLGDWSCTFRAELIGDSKLKIKGFISFTEKANDYTTIVGEYERTICVKELENFTHFRLGIETPRGNVAGANIGARGYRWFSGEGIIQKAYIQTDTFGEDAGRIGGKIRFNPIEITIQRHYAASEDQAIQSLSAK